MRWTIGRRLGAAFALPLVILLGVGGTSYRALGALLETNAWVRHTYQVLDTIAALEAAISEGEAWQRAYLIAGNEDLLERCEAVSGRPDRAIEQIRELTADNPTQQRRIEPLKALIATQTQTQRRRLELRRTKNLDAVEAALPVSASVQLSDQIHRAAGEMRDEETRLLKIRTEESEAQARTTRGVILMGSLLGFLLVLVFGVVIARSITGPIESGIQHLASSASEILGATTQQASGTQEAGAAIQETSTTVQEVKQTAQLASEKAQMVAELVRRTAHTSQEGRRATEETLAGMRESKVRMEGIARRVLELSEQGQRIGEIITAANDVAEQSNLLAVNAAIEAAKAGEAGLGFGVVATEVKALAELSKQATSQVRQILGEVQRATQAAVLATEQGVKAADAGEAIARRTGETIEVLSESLSEAAQSAQQIQVTAQEQLAGVDQVASAMGNIKQVSIQNIAATRQVERSARDLNALAQRFRNLVRGDADPGGGWTSRDAARGPTEE